MKQCPKCPNYHNKPGIYCSRTCANSRSWSEESNRKRSATMIGRNNVWQRDDPDKASASIEKGKQTKLEKYLSTPFDELGSENRRRRVLEEQDYSCNRCKLKEWQGFPIMLELEHKDGNNKNNVRENLEGLCPNCHSLTPTWRGRKR